MTCNWIRAWQLAGISTSALILFACRPEQPTSPMPAAALTVSPGAQHSTVRMGEEHRRNLERAVKESYPELLEATTPGEKAAVFMILNGGEVERKALKLDAGSMSTSDALQFAFPDESARSFASAGVASLRPGDGTPNTVVVFWWERERDAIASSRDAIRFATTPVPESQIQETINRLHPDAYNSDKGVWVVATAAGAVLRSGTVSRDVFRNSMLVGDYLRSRFPDIKVYSMRMGSVRSANRTDAALVAWAVLADGSPLPE